MKHSPEDIFGAFRDPNLLSKWWGPKGFTSTIQIHDFCAGGDWKFIMHGPDGTDYPNENKFVSIKESQEIVIQHDLEPKFILTVKIEREATGSIVTWNQQFEDEITAKKVEPYARPANEQNLQKLDDVLVGLVPNA